MKVNEGKAQLNLTDKVFFNPQMEFCRDISSIGVGAYCEEIGKRIHVVDGLCATGVRGIRYKLESSCVGKVEFVDMDENACKLAERNAKLNKLRNYEVHCCHINDFLFHNKRFDWVELDPFGTPLPYLQSALASFRKQGMLSVTATDTAVLCGAHQRACLKNYGAMPIDNEYCHEIGVRILAGTIVRFASSLNLGTDFCLSLSVQHFFKLFAKLKTGADGAVASMKKMGYISHCPKCLNREWRFNPPILKEKCPRCGGKFEHAGPLFLGELWNERFLAGMRRINQGRDYKNKWKIDETLSIMQEETGMPPTYFDLHKIAEKAKKSPPNFESFVKRLREGGFRVSKTHFKSNSVRSNAGIKKIMSIF
ncbi:MAG: tRNA (guanine(26)-N(2))-dimethyltransferase [Candidatus Fermentimicrarchaeum limneticum]|uniref:tRNA (guanine(26)-N(2))-dimethyltransferase n=1 Tax=Fermentimicrarchaeum limneticum TaxID=2795018 RepID=A0A7D5XHB3_FERL1|nr:MAG: tRNA (guanine(26)-N(2))-dimethyltransferase [Candidatus Fermentimicrarchaeum limneticum]